MVCKLDFIIILLIWILTRIWLAIIYDKFDKRDHSSFLRPMIGGVGRKTGKERKHSSYDLFRGKVRIRYDCRVLPIRFF